VSDPEEVMQVIRAGTANRAVGFTSQCLASLLFLFDHFTRIVHSTFNSFQFQFNDYSIG
jgi:hypothetical protein